MRWTNEISFLSVEIVSANERASSPVAPPMRGQYESTPFRVCVAEGYGDQGEGGTSVRLPSVCS